MYFVSHLKTQKKPKQNYKTRTLTITTFLQHYTGGPSRCSKMGGKGVRKGRNQRSVFAEDSFVYLNILKKIYQSPVGNSKSLAIWHTTLQDIGLEYKHQLSFRTPAANAKHIFKESYPLWRHLFYIITNLRERSCYKAFIVKGNEKYDSNHIASGSNILNISLIKVTKNKKYLIQSFCLPIKI